MSEKNKQKFPRYGFRRNTHTKEGVFNEESTNEWQAHIWNRTEANKVGNLIPVGNAISFETFLKKYKEKFPNGEMDDEEISALIVKLIECGLVVVEKIEDYETDIYDDKNPFWKNKK